MAVELCAFGGSPAFRASGLWAVCGVVLLGVFGLHCFLGVGGRVAPMCEPPPDPLRQRSLAACRLILRGACATALKDLPDCLLGHARLVWAGVGAVC